VHACVQCDVERGQDKYHSDHASSDESPNNAETFITEADFELKQDDKPTEPTEPTGKSDADSFDS